MIKTNLKSSKKILIIEDEEPILQLLIEAFGKEGFEVIHARDGEEGLTTALSHHPDIILSDIVLPKVDGMTMLSEIREDVWGKNVPVIFLTNLNNDDRISKDVRRIYPTFYLVKTGWRVEDVVSKVRERLNLEFQAS